MRIALAWTAIAVIATVLAIAHVFAIGRQDLMLSTVLNSDAFVVIWALATPVIFRASARYRVNGAKRVAMYALAFAIFFVVTNAVALPEHLMAALTLNAIPAALAFVILVAIGHWLATKRELTHVAIADRGRTHRVPVDAIHWIEAEDNYVLIHTPERTYTARERISDFESKLDAARFARVHRSAIINIARVSEVRSLSHGDYEVVLNCGTSVRGSRSRRAALRSILRDPIERVVVGAASANETGP